MPTPTSGNHELLDLTLRSALLSIDPRRLMIWSGAGISADPPTSAPVAGCLTARVLSYGFEPEVGPLVSCYYRYLGLPRVQPRLETLLDVVERVHGGEAVADLLSDLAGAPPNGIHRFLARLADHGADQVTVNFDTCLEEAGAANVLHLHGALASNPTADLLGATIARIERGLSPAVAEELLRRIEAASVILIVGYSGSDFFDVDPFLAALPNGVGIDKHVLWVRHGDDPASISEDEEAAKCVRQLGFFRDAGAHVTLIKARTRTVLAALAAQLEIAPPALTEGGRSSWRPRLAPDEASRQRATLELYSMMGLKREVERLLDIAPLDEKRRLALLGDVRWFQGRYREAATARRRAVADSRSVRRATDYWIRGQYVKARHVALRAVKEADAAASRVDQVPLEERLLRAEVLARIWQHMRRTPDSRLLATKRLRRFALEHLPDPALLARQQQPLGTHLQVRIRGARAALGAASEPAAAGTESFDQYEALGGWLNYRHGALRDEARRGQPEPSSYRLLYRDHLAVGAPGDAARVVLLPGAERAFTMREALTALRVLDVTPWHRVRLVLYLAWRRRHLHRLRA